jgi:electron transport complex protein RnfB
VDCIALENVTDTRTGWAAWSEQEAQTSRARYESRQIRLVREEAIQQARLITEAEHTLADLPAHTKGADKAPEMDRKRAIIEAALAKAKARQTGA